MAGFLFGGNTGRTYEQLQEQRRTADALAAQIMGKTPTTTMGGIGALIAGIGTGISKYRTDKALKEGTANANAGFESYIRDRLLGNSTDGSPYAVGSNSASGAIPMPGAASEIAATSPNGGGMQNYRDAIASIESKGSGDYSAVGPTHPKMGRALGRYQIMEANIGPWSQAALGRAVTPEEFMANPQLQDAVFDHQFGQYVQKYGPEGAAQAWLGGPGGVGKTGRRDSLGTSIGDYGKRFMAAGGGAQVASLDPSAGMSAADAIETVAPNSGGYRDPMVSAPNAYRGSDYNSPMVTYDDRGMRVERPSQQMPQPQLPAQQPAPTQVAQNGGGYFPAAPQPSSAPNAPQPPRAPSNADNIRQLMRWANDPFLSPQMKAQAQMMLQQEMKNAQSAEEEQQWRARQDYQNQQQQRDPLYQLKLEAARKEVETGKRQPIINLGDGTAYDPNDKPPSGYVWNDPADQSAGLSPIPGGPGEEISAEVAGRIGLSDVFLKNYGALRQQLAAGTATGLWDRAQAGMNQSSPQARVYREMESGTDALTRMLSGAGMNETEARSYARRYLPTYTDDAESAVSKLDQLKAELEGTRAMVLRGRGNMPSPASLAPQGDGSTPSGVSADVWNVMTPEERALWK